LVIAVIGGCSTIVHIFGSLPWETLEKIYLMLIVYTLANGYTYVNGKIKDE